MRWVGLPLDVFRGYFDRCNKLNYFTDNDSDDGRCFEIRATAYSGIGLGALFSIDINKGTEKVVDREGIEKALEVEEDDDDEAGDDRCEEIIEDDDEEAESDLDVLDEIYLLESKVHSETDVDCKELKSANAAHHSTAKMVTGVKIERYMRLGDVILAQKSDQRRVKWRLEQESGWFEGTGKCDFKGN